jgi:hypothetical protein
MYAALFGISGALHLAVFEQTEKHVFLDNVFVSCLNSVFIKVSFRTQ